MERSLNVWGMASLKCVLLCRAACSHSITFVRCCLPNAGAQGGRPAGGDRGAGGLKPSLEAAGTWVEAVCHMQAPSEGGPLLATEALVVDWLLITLD